MPRPFFRKSASISATTRGARHVARRRRRVKGDRVRFPRAWCVRCSRRRRANSSSMRETRPACHGRRQQHGFAPVYGPPFVRKLDEGRRYATIEDFRNFVKLAYMSPCAAPFGRNGLRAGRHSGRQAPSRHGLQPHPLFRQTFMGSVDRAGAAEDSVDDGKDGVRRDFVDQNCVMINLINANSPLVFDGPWSGH